MTEDEQYIEDYIPAGTRQDVARDRCRSLTDDRLLILVSRGYLPQARNLAALDELLERFQQRSDRLRRIRDMVS